MPDPDPTPPPAALNEALNEGLNEGPPGALGMVRRAWRAVPLKGVAALTVAGLCCTALHPRGDGRVYPNGEFYPLSSYPMYSHFDGLDYYVYLADADGAAVACKDFGITAPKLKKRFKGELKQRGLSEAELRERKLAPGEIGPVADKVLRRVAGARQEGARLGAGDELTMVLVYVWGEAGRIEKREYRVAGVVLGG